MRSAPAFILLALAGCAEDPLEPGPEPPRAEWRADLAGVPIPDRDAGASNARLSSKSLRIRQGTTLWTLRFHDVEPVEGVAIDLPATGREVGTPTVHLNLRKGDRSRSWVEGFPLKLRFGPSSTVRIYCCAPDRSVIAGRLTAPFSE